MDVLRGKNGIVTGAAHGIGVPIAHALGAEGVNLAVVDNREDGSLAVVSGELRAYGGQAVDIIADITDADDRAALLDEVDSRLGPVDILINNAAVIEWIRFIEQDAEHIDRIIDTNLLAPMHLGRMILPGMVARGSGHIVNHASLNGKRGIPFDAVYSASKAGLIQWGNAMRVELEGTGVGMTSVISGFVTEVGMSADHGIPAPRLTGPIPPAKVVEAVLQALRDDPPEIIVRGLPTRPLLAIGELFPRLADPILKWSGAVDLHRRLAERRWRSF